MSADVNLGQVRPDENALWSYGPHDVSIALQLLGEMPTKIVAQGRSYIQDGIEDVVWREAHPEIYAEKDRGARSNVTDLGSRRAG